MKQDFSPCSSFFGKLQVVMVVRAGELSWYTLVRSCVRKTLRKISFRFPSFDTVESTRIEPFLAENRVILD